MDYPRIHFVGRHFADVNTINNDPVNFKLSMPTHEFDKGWHPLGGNEWSLQDCAVTSVVYQNGSRSNNVVLEPLIGAAVVTNPSSVEGKIVSIDVFAQNKSILFGVTLGVRQSVEDSFGFAFTGEWLPNSVLHQNAWRQVLCDDSDLDTHYDGARSVSRLRNVKWGDSLQSEAMRQLREASKKHGGQLVISATLYDFCYDSEAGNFSYGRISGTIGVARPSEPRFFEGERLLSFEYVDQPHLQWPESDSCSRQKYAHWRPHWAYRAPFKVHRDRRVLTIDFSSSFARNLNGGVRDIGDLYLGVIRSPDQRHLCIDLLASIDYHGDRCHYENSCVFDLPLDDSQFKLVEKHRLVVVRPRQHLTSTATTFPLCIAPLLGILSRRWKSHSFDMIVMMLEQHYYIRPFNHYTHFMEKGDLAMVDFLVTSRGKPARGEVVYLTSASPWVKPSNGVLFNQEAKVDSKGHAKFLFLASSVGYPRREIDLDGQVYQFVYHIKGEPVYCSDEVKIAKGTSYVEATCTDAVTIKIFSDIRYDSDRPFTWVEHVEPVLSLYARLYPQMKTVVDLGRYEDVVKPQIIHLLNYTLLLDFDHPNHMPVSRDLSAIKRAMIVEWLAKPCFNSTHCLTNSSVGYSSENKAQLLENPSIDHTYASTVRSCGATGDFRQQPHDSDNYFARTASFDPKFGTAQGANCFADLKRSRCSLIDVQHCLQKALELEFYTIPLYLTALYSIKDGHNRQVYDLIRSVVMQEMLHMLQVANLLIAVGGRPTIDSASAAPSYPAKGLPGGVLPQLEVSLQKASLDHIHKVFMAIEYPHEIINAHNNIDVIHKQTIGQLYGEIENCLKQHGDRVFLPNRTSFQINWPYSNDYGHVFVVKDIASAEEAVNEIVEQGEGMQPGDPHSNRREDLAHFFKFQEIVCGRELEFHGVSNYSFTGPPIPFDEKGVWPMRDNPGSKGLKPGTKVYNRARVFHQTYRSLLRKLDDVFGGNPKGVSDAMSIMESLMLQMKALMAMPVEGSETVTCGPVFEYEWKD